MTAFGVRRAAGGVVLVLAVACRPSARPSVRPSAYDPAHARITVSLATAPTAAVRTAGLAIAYGAPEITAIPVPAGPPRLNVVLSIILVATIGVLWIVFR